MIQSNRAGEHGASGECPECGEALVWTWCRFCGWHPEESKITQGEIRQIAAELEEKTATKNDADRFLEIFCDDVEHGETPPAEVMRFLNVAFRAYLAGERKLETALSLKRPKKGRPKANEDERQIMAIDVLRHRLDGMSHQEALEETAGIMGWGITVIGEAWAAHHQSALESLSVLRAATDEFWTPEELAKINEFYERRSGKIDE